MAPCEEDPTRGLTRDVEGDLGGKSKDGEVEFANSRKGAVIRIKGSGYAADSDSFSGSSDEDNEESKVEPLEQVIQVSSNPKASKEEFRNDISDVRIVNRTDTDLEDDDEYFYDYEYEIYEYEYQYEDETDDESSKREVIARKVSHEEIKRYAPVAPKKPTPKHRKKQNEVSEHSTFNATEAFLSLSLDEKLPQSDLPRTSRAGHQNSLKLLAQEFIQFKKDFNFNDIISEDLDLNQSLSQGLGLDLQSCFVEVDILGMKDHVLSTKVKLLAMSSSAFVMRISMKKLKKCFQLNDISSHLVAADNLDIPFFKKQKKLGAFELSVVHSILLSDNLRTEVMNGSLQQFWTKNKHKSVQQRSILLEQYSNSFDQPLRAQHFEKGDKYHYICFFPSPEGEIFMLDPLLESPQKLNLRNIINENGAEAKFSAFCQVADFIKDNFPTFQNMYVLTNPKMAIKFGFEHYKGEKYRIQSDLNSILFKAMPNVQDSSKFQLPSDLKSADDLTNALEDLSAIAISIPNRISEMVLRRKNNENQELGDRILFFGERLGELQPPRNRISTILEVVGNMTSDNHLNDVALDVSQIVNKYKKLPKSVRTDHFSEENLGSTQFAFQNDLSKTHEEFTAIEEHRSNLLLFVRARERASKKLKIILLDPSSSCPRYIYHNDRVGSSEESTHASKMETSDKNFVDDVMNFLNQLLHPVFQEEAEKGIQLCDRLGINMFLLKASDKFDKVLVLPETLKDLRKKKLEERKIQKKKQEEERIQREAEEKRNLELKAEIERQKQKEERERKKAIQLENQKRAKQLEADKKAAAKLQPKVVVPNRAQDKEKARLAAEARRKEAAAQKKKELETIALKKKQEEDAKRRVLQEKATKSAAEDAKERELFQQKLKKFTETDTSAKPPAAEPTPTKAITTPKVNIEGYLDYLQDFDEDDDNKVEALKHQKLLDKQKKLERESSERSMKPVPFKPNDLESMNKYASTILGVKQNIKAVGEYKLNDINPAEFSNKGIFGVVVKFPKSALSDRHTHLGRNLAVNDSSYYLVPLPNNDFSLSCSNAITNLMLNNQKNISFQANSTLEQLLDGNYSFPSDNPAGEDSGERGSKAVMSFGVTKTHVQKEKTKDELAKAISGCKEIFPSSAVSQDANTEQSALAGFGSGGKSVYSAFMLIKNGGKSFLYELEGSLGQNRAVLHGTSSEKNLLKQVVQVLKDEFPKNYGVSEENVVLYPFAK